MRPIYTAIALLIAAPCLPSAVNAETTGGDWWIEVARERELPTALLEKRKRDAELEKRKEAEKAKEGGDGVKDKVKALLKALPKAKRAAEEAEAEAEKKAEEKKAEEEKAAADDTEEKPEAAPADPEAEDGEKKDDAVADEKADKPEETPEAAEPVEPEKISLTVSMSGQIVALDGESLRFRPTLQPDRELILPLKTVTSLSRHAPGKAPTENPPDLEFRVVLRDGSEVPGRLMGLGDKAMTVALVGSGAKIDLPLGEIARVERNDPSSEAVASGNILEAPDRHVAALSTGEIVAGQLLPSRDSDKWLRVSSPILTVECPLSLIDLLVFPDPDAAAGAAEEALADVVVEVEDPGNNGTPAKPVEPEPPADDPEPEPEPEPETEAEPDIRHLVSLSPAGMLWAKKLEMRDGNLLVSALGKEGFAVPLDRVESVSFGHEGLPSTAPVLVWGAYSDEDDEFRKTLDALDDHIPGRKLLRSMSKVPDADFMRQLRRARVLLVPEMESFNRATLKGEVDKAGNGIPSWKEAFRGFMRRGGNVIFLSPTGEALNFFNECGFGPLRSGGSGAGWEFTNEGKKLGVKFGGAMGNVNATHYYRKADPWQIWGAAKDGGNGAVVIGRRMERGWVMVMGTDFYETKPELTETLLRLIEFRGRR